AEVIASQRVAGMNADADDVARGDRRDVERLERLVHDLRVAPPLAGGGGQDVQPARRDHRDAEGLRTGVDEMDSRHRHPFLIDYLAPAVATPLSSAVEVR